jgi:hypothetical protein
MGIIRARGMSGTALIRIRCNPRYPLFAVPIPLTLILCYSGFVLRSLSPKGALTMEWVTPQHEEIDLNCEVSSYANAEL